MDKNSFYKYQETRAKAGYGCAWLVKEQNETKYTLLVASETIPSVFGSVDSFEFDLINSPVKGKVKGKVTLDDKEVEILHTRDNVYRLNKFKDKVLDFIYLDGTLGGYKYTGTLSYRANDGQADIHRGTITISPMSADENYYFDLRSEIEEPLYFAEVIPDEVKVGDKINAVVVQTDAAATYEYAKLATDGTETAAETGFTEASGVITVGSTVTEGLYVITAKSSKYASWSTTVYVKAAA